MTDSESCYSTFWTIGHSNWANPNLVVCIYQHSSCQQWMNLWIDAMLWFDDPELSYIRKHLSVDESSRYYQPICHVCLISLCSILMLLIRSSSYTENVSKSSMINSCRPKNIVYFHRLYFMDMRKNKTPYWGRILTLWLTNRHLNNDTSGLQKTK